MEEQGGQGGLGPPTFLAGGARPPHFSVENKGIIKKKLINAAAGFGPSGRGMARPPHFKLRSSIYERFNVLTVRLFSWVVMCLFFKSGCAVLGLFHQVHCPGQPPSLP